MVEAREFPILRTIEDARRFRANAQRHGDVEAVEHAYRRESRLAAEAKQLGDDVDTQIAEAVFTLERVKSLKAQKAYHASRTWQMIRRRGPKAAAERTVLKPKASDGFDELKEAGLIRFAFESIVAANPDRFSKAAVEASMARLAGRLVQRPGGKNQSVTKDPEVQRCNAILADAQWAAIALFDASRSDDGLWTRTKAGAFIEGLPKKSGAAMSRTGIPNVQRRSARHVSMRLKHERRKATFEWIRVEGEAPRLYVVARNSDSPSLPIEGTPYDGIEEFVVGKLQLIEQFDLEDADLAYDAYLRELEQFMPPNPDLSAGNAALSLAEKRLHESSRMVYVRRRAVKQIVLGRAQGVCEGCRAPAPFTTKAGRPYLEVHHVDNLQESGIDDARGCVAVCPNCHQRAHHGVDSSAFALKLKMFLGI